MLAEKATTICVAYRGMERFFPKNHYIGNPCRQDLVISEENRRLGYEFFHLDPSRKTILMVGGSLGARTLNASLVAALPDIAHSDVQVIWQCGKYYYEDMSRWSARVVCRPTYASTISFRAWIMPYSVADLVISRAGAGSISELCLLQKPVILVPSPNVAEDHQTKNALALVRKGCCRNNFGCRCSGQTFCYGPQSCARR